MKKLLFIINPNAGTKLKKINQNIIDNNVDKSLFDYKIVFTEYAGHATEIAKNALEEGVNIIAVCGGDGSLNDVAKVLVNTSVVIALIPVGGGNGVAHKLNIPINPIKALNLITNGKVINMDSGVINGYPFFMTPGVGFDAFMLHDFSKGKIRGMLGYLRSVIRTAFRFKSFEIEMTLDDERPIKRSLYTILFSNIGQMGYGINYDKTSEVDDGFLEIVILKVFPKWKVFWVMFVILFLDPTKSSFAEWFKYKKIKATVSAEQYLQVDGDYKTELTTIDSYIVPKSIKIIVPQ